MIAGILILLLFLLFAGLIMVTFSMILHGARPVSLFATEGIQQNKWRWFLPVYPFAMWIPVYLTSELTHVSLWHSVVYFYACLLLALIASEGCYRLRKVSLLYRLSLWINLLNGAFIIILLLVYHLKID